jgi:mannose-6-phosphate isomerase-like protein (cupin superfamily)
MESFYIVSGTAEISDNGEPATVSAGDSILTRSGEGHAVKNTGSVPLEMIALILYK